MASVDTMLKIAVGALILIVLRDAIGDETSGGVFQSVMDTVKTLIST